MASSTTKRSASLFVSAIALSGDAAPADPPEALMAALRRLWQVLHDGYENFELLVLDDGLDDAARAQLRVLLTELDCVRVIRLSRRFGRDAALAAGLESAIGDVVVALDLRTDPVELVPELVARCRQGSGAVVGVDPLRTGQSDWEKAGARWFYRVARRVCDLESVEHATSLMALSRPALGALLKIKEQSRHPQLFLPYIGFDLQRLTYRPGGRTSRARGLFGSVDRAIDLLVTGSMRPLRLISWLSLSASAVNALWMLYVVLIALFKDHVAEGWPTQSLQSGTMFFLLFLVLAVLGEYVGRILGESRRRPQYVLLDEWASSVVVEREKRRNVVGEST